MSGGIMTKSTTRNHFRIFPKIDSELAATDACRQSGLIVFLLAFLPALVAIMEIGSFGSGDGSILSFIFYGSFAIALVVIGLQIRSGNYWLIPYTVPIITILFVLNSLYNILSDILAHESPAGPGGMMIFAQILYFAIRLLIPIALIVIAYNGMRGWNWLRKNGATHSA